MTCLNLKALALFAFFASPAIGQTSFGFDPVKTCEVSMHPTGAYVLDCTITIDHPLGPPMSPTGNPVTLGVVDILTQNGQPITDSSIGDDGTSGFACAEGSFPVASTNGMSPAQSPLFPGYGCTISSNQLPSVTQTTLTLQSHLPPDTTGVVTNCVHGTLWNPDLPDGRQAGPQYCVDIDLDAYVSPPPPPTSGPTVEKTCEEPVTQADGSISVDCSVSVSFDSGADFMAGEAGNLPIHIVDTLTLNGDVLPGATTLTSANEPWSCTEGPFAHFPEDQDQTPRTVCTLGGPDAYQAATSGAGGRAGSAMIALTSTFPPGSTGTAENCAFMAHFLIPDASMSTEPACVTIDLPEPADTDTGLAPVSCEAFTPEVTCNKVTGNPVVTLKNKYSKLFSPKAVAITSLTPGVTVRQSTADPLSVQLTGAGPGDTVSLSTEAVDKGAGSQAGLDLCCMGEISVKIPEGFTCEPEQKLEVTKTCDTGINPAIDTDADCEITVHYEGPPPSASNPIKITESVTGMPWAFTTTPLSGDDWNCPPVPDATPFTCTISATDEPGANWQNWTSTLIVQMSVGDEFENCVTATAAGGLEDKVCWSTESPELTIEKRADQAQCVAGKPCTFTINVANPSAVDYTGPITLGDQITDVSPSVLTDPGTFVSISPALCAPSDLTQGNCTGLAGIPAGGTQSYTVTWIPPAMVEGAETATVTNCVKGAFAHGSMSVVNAPDGSSGEPAYPEGQSCAEVTLLPPEITISKTGPASCGPGQSCDYQLTVSTTNQPFSGPVMLMDDAPNGFVITGISPMPQGCGSNLPANPMACVVPVNLNANDAVSYTVSIKAINPEEMTEPFTAENCAGLWSVPADTAPGDYSVMGYGTGGQMPAGFDELMEGAGLVGQSCAPVVWTPDGPDPDVEIVKTCEPATQMGPHVMANCTITVTTSGPVQTNLTVTENFAGSGQVEFTTIQSGWACANGQCEVAGSNLSQILSVSTFGAQVMFNAGAEAEGTNCAILALDGQEHARSCVEITAEDVGEDQPGQVDVVKTCAPLVQEANPVLTYKADCVITVTVTGGDYPGHLNVQDVLTAPKGGTVGPMVPTSPGWTCDTSQCLIGPMAAGVYTVGVPVAGLVLDQGETATNCAQVAAVPTGTGMTEEDWTPLPESCVSLSLPPSTNKLGQPSAPALSVVKTSTGVCVPDVAAQTYDCGFDLTLTNTGSGAFAGPMVLGDAFDPGMVSAVTGTGAGWSCSLAGDAASCINGNLSLAPGAASTVALSVTVKGQREGGRFTNCGSIGAGSDPTGQAIIVQTALTLMGVDIGAVDGKPGKRTRAAVADLQKQFGQEPDGEIDADLLAALGVPLASEAEKSCVTVDLPPMPRPPLQCEKATTKLSDGECVCRFKNMYQADKTSCACVKGTKFVAGEGCVKVKDKPKTLNCDPETTVLRNGKCQCRQKGMERISKSACAKPKKKQEIRICPNGLPEIPGLGCVDIQFNRKGDGNPHCDPAVQECG